MNSLRSMAGLTFRGLELGLALGIWLFLNSFLPTNVSGSPLPPRVIRSLDAVLECERPDGGWMYVCERNRRVAGYTNIMKKAEWLAGAVNMANWDLIVLRSPGTPAAGLLLLQAYKATGQGKYLNAALRTGDLLVNLQLPAGGWFSEMPVHGNQLARWFRVMTPWNTLDDDVTPGAVRFLFLLWETTGRSRYRDSAERGLDLLIAAQLPSGAWPLTWRPGWLRSLRPNFEDWPSLNDAATTAPIHTLLVAARILHRPELLDAARHAAEWILDAQHPAPHAGWAQQYDPEDRPVPGRSFEPAALATWESRQALEALDAVAKATGDRHFCSAFPKAVDWLARSALSPGCWARYYSFEAGTPTYISREGKPVDSIRKAKRPYRWQGDFGIPFLMMSLGLKDGRNLPEPVKRIPGDSGECSDDPRWQPMDARSPRGRISRAASLLASLDPPKAMVCSGFLLRKERETR